MADETLTSNPLCAPTKEELILPAEQSFSDAAVHHMCGYLRGDYKCERCPRRTQTPYGEGMHGCYALAEETLVVAKEAMKL